MEDVLEILQNIGTTAEEHRRICLGECRLVIDAPVVVRTLADGEDLVLQRVGIVTDDTDLDDGRHFTWFGMLSPKPKKPAIRFDWFRTMNRLQYIIDGLTYFV